MAPTNVSTLKSVTEDQLGHLVHLHQAEGPASAATFLAQGREIFTFRLWRGPHQDASSELAEALELLTSSSEADAIVLGSAAHMVTHPNADGTPGDAVVSVGVTLVGDLKAAWGAVRLRQCLDSWCIDPQGSHDLMADTRGIGLMPSDNADIIEEICANYCGPRWDQDDFFRALDLFDESHAMTGRITGFVSKGAKPTKRLHDPMGLMGHLRVATIPVQAAIAA